TASALVRAEQIRRRRMANGPSSVSINTGFDHPRTNPLLPLACYDGPDADGDDGEAVAEEKKETEQESEDEATSWQSISFPMKQVMRGSTIEDEREALKRASGGTKGVELE